MSEPRADGDETSGHRAPTEGRERDKRSVDFALRGGVASRRPRTPNASPRADVSAALDAREPLEEALRELSACVGRVQAILSAHGGQEHSGPASVTLSEDTAAARSRPASIERLPLLAATAKPYGSDSCESVLRVLEAEEKASRCSKNSRVSFEAEANEKQALLAGVALASGKHCVNAETLPDTWPSSLEIRLQATFPASEASGSPRRKSSVYRRMSYLSGDGDEGVTSSFPSQRVSSRRKAWFVISPSSHGRMAFDTLSAALLGFDVVVIPWMIAWDVSPAGGLYYMAFVTAVFWTLDIFLSFITAVQVGDECVYDLNTIARRYSRAWLVPDTIICLGDWMSLMAMSSAGWRTFRLAKIGRLLRILALFRLLKFIRVLSDMIEERLSDFAQLMFRFTKMICITLVYAHIISCMWFFIGRAAPTDTGNRWLDNRNLTEANMWYQYATSFHWAMSQITLGAMEITSETLIERIYSVICLITGLLFGSTLVSTLSATMLEAQMDKREARLKMQMMHRYLRENSVDGLLAARVERQLRERLAVRHKIKEEQVTGLELLSSSMRSQLQFHLVAPHLKRHSLFRLWIDVDSGFVEHFCRRCMDFVHLRTQDDLFAAGKVAECAYFFVSGKMMYTQEPASSPVEETTAQEVEEGRWMVEAALWSHWVHVGTAQATQFTEVARVRVGDVMEAMQRSTTVCQLTVDYCRKFHDRLQFARPPMLKWPDDLQVPLTDWSEMVLAMSVESQAVIGLEAIRQAALRRTWLKAPTGLDKLVDEVNAGRSTVMLNGEGEMERAVSVVAFKICNEDGQVLVQIGKQQSGKIKHACQLPGGKTHRGELVVHAVERLLEDRLASLSDHVHVSAIERQTQWQESKEYGVRTKYLRHIIICTLVNGSCLEDAKVPDVSWAIHSPRGTSPRVNKANSLLSMSMSVQHRRSFTSLASNTGRNGTVQPHASHQSQCSETSDVRRSLYQRSVFRIEDSKGDGALYGWLSEHEFELLRSPLGERLLPAWIEMQQARLDNMKARDEKLACPGKLAVPIALLQGYESEEERRAGAAADGWDGRARRLAGSDEEIDPPAASPRAGHSGWVGGGVLGRAGMVADLARKKTQVWI